MALALCTTLALFQMAPTALAETPTPTPSPSPTSTPTPVPVTPPPSALTPVPGAPTPVLRLFPFKLVLTGPRQAVAGSVITYSLQYSRVQEPGAATAERGIVLLYGRDASLVSMRATEGPPPIDLGPQNPGLSENVELPADAGSIEFLIRPHAGFSGVLEVNVYVRGTAIRFPSGSITHVQTEVVAPSSAINLPGTGAGAGSTSTAAPWRGVLYGALGGAFAAGIAGLAFMRRSKWERSNRVAR